MSKAEGKRVGVKFTQPLTSGTEAPIIENETQKGIWSASGSYSIYNPIGFVKDANIGTIGNQGQHLIIFRYINKIYF